MIDVEERISQVVALVREALAPHRIILFGSRARGSAVRGSDIDLAVEGAPPELFFKFYARLFMALPKPVDLVDLSQDIPIASIIRAKGVSIYER